MKKGQNSLSIESFYTVPKSTEGVKLFLHLPDGQKTEEFLILRGIDSKEYKIATYKATREALEAINKHGDEDGNLEPEKEIELIEEKEITRCCSLVVGWSFKKYEFNEENIKKFLSQSPDTINKILVFASDRSNFFTKPSSN